MARVILLFNLGAYTIVEWVNLIWCDGWSSYYKYGRPFMSLDRPRVSARTVNVKLLMRKTVLY